MVSSFSNLSFPPVHAHPTRLPAMDARLSAAIDSFEASMSAAVRGAMDSARDAIHKAMNPVIADIRLEIALLRCDLALGIKGDSVPASMCSAEAESIKVSHQNLQNGDGNPLRISSTIHDHSIPPLLSSSLLLRAMANSHVQPPHLNAFVSATIPLRNVEKTKPVALVNTTPLLFPILTTFSTESAYAHSHKTVLSTKEATTMAHVLRFPLRNIRATKSAGLSHTNITKCRHEVLRSLIYNLSHWKAKWHWLLQFILAYYLGVIVVIYDVLLPEINGWVNWYLVRKFVKADFYALELFEELSKRPLCETYPMAKFAWSATNNTATVEWYNACQEAQHNKGTLFNFMLPKTFLLTTHGNLELHIATSWQMLKSFWNASTIHFTTHGNLELHIATSWQMLKSFWNASTITDYILEIEFLWEKDIKVVPWGGNATSLIFSALESWLVVEHNTRGFEQQWLSLTFSWATSEAVMAKARSQWYFPYQKTQVSIIKAQVKSSSISPSYMAHQTNINKKMSVILIDWLIKVHYKFEHVVETQFLTVNLIVRFLVRQMVIRKRFHLVGVTAILLACKYEEVYGEMLDKGVNPDEFTYVLLTVKKIMRDIPSYQFIIKTLSDAGKLDKALNVVDTMLDDDGVELFNNPNKKAMLFLNFASESSDAFKSTYREVAEKYKKEEISFFIGDLKVVVTDGIQEEVKYGKYVLLEFYAPCCGHCEKLVPILDEVVVSYEKDSNVVIAKLQATANGVPSDSDVKYYHLPQRLQDQMLAHLCLKYRTDSEDLHQQEPLDMVYLFLVVSNDLFFQLVSEMKAEYFPPKEDVILQKIAPIDSYIFVIDVVDLVVLKNRVEQGRGEHQPSDLENKNMECASWLLCARPLGMETERTIAEQIRGYTEPYAEKLLPDLHPMKKHVFSPVLDFQETLLHSLRMQEKG